MQEVGCEQLGMVVKSDQNPTMSCVVEEVDRVRSTRSRGSRVVECGLLGSGASSGVAERAFQSVEQQVRVLQSALEERWRRKIPAQHSVVPWLAEYSSFLLNRCEVQCTKDAGAGKPGRLVLSSARWFSGSERKSAGPGGFVGSSSGFGEYGCVDGFGFARCLQNVDSTKKAGT